MLLSKSFRAAPLKRVISRQASLSFSSFASRRRLILASQKLTAKPYSKVQPSLQSAFFATSSEASATAPEEPVNQNFAAVATGGIPYPGIPKIEDPYQKRQWQLEHMAGAFRVFARMGFTEGAAGHISVRDPVDPSTFWINP
ncbi:hypothetical protein LB505_005779 [Fusarium chuoi]|nr:hypothetical protein LB505_005779 [Fusarium chuoi]